MTEHDDVRSLADTNREADGGTQEQKMQLGEMITAAMQECEAADAELLHQTLAPLATQVSAGTQSTGWLANLSFLGDRHSTEQFLTAVDEFRQQHPHLDLRVKIRCRPTASSTAPPPSRSKAAPRMPSRPRLPSRTEKGALHGP